jgi:hypothetical protein
MSRGKQRRQRTDAACRPHVQAHEEQVGTVARRSIYTLRLQVVLLLQLSQQPLLLLLLLLLEQAEGTLLLTEQRNRGRSFFHSQLRPPPAYNSALSHRSCREAPPLVL